MVPAMHNNSAAGDGLGATIKYLHVAAGIDLGSTIKYLRGSAGIGLCATTKYLRRSTSGAAGNGLCTTTKYMRGVAGIWPGHRDQVPAAHNESRCEHPRALEPRTRQHI